MEALVMIQEVGAYSERQYQRQDGTSEYFKSKNRDTQFSKQVPYVVKGYWKHRTWEDQNHQQRHENSFYITDIQTL